MLQQTRVETATAYWLRFMERFPSVAALAAADEDEVLALWSGLGYYRRARNLHAAARAIVAAGGAFPSTREQLLELPGVGPYTAGAVASIAFDRPEPLVDGNVARVFARWFELRDAPGGALEARSWGIARELVPERGAGEWNQALMELGALVCKPRSPECASCPVREDCGALRSECVSELPVPKPRRAPIDVRLCMFVCRAGDALLLERRAAGGRMAGMWQLPTLEIGPGTALFTETWSEGSELALEAGEELGELTHGITHHRIRARLVRGRLASNAIVREPYAWHAVDALADLATTGLTRKVIARGLHQDGAAGQEPLPFGGGLRPSPPHRGNAR